MQWFVSAVYQIARRISKSWSFAINWILERKQKRTITPNRAEKLFLAVLTARLKQAMNRPGSQLREVIRILQPETVLSWHRELVRRKWTFKRKAQGGRPRISLELEALIVRLARENSRWGYGKIEGELLKLGFTVSASTVRNVLNRHGILPAPVRYGSIGWRHLMRHYKQQLLACDFFTVETIWLQTLYVLFFIELGTRRVYLAGMGMPLAFSESEADFSGMAEIPPGLHLYISRVLHKAYVAVNELGTEAAAATEVEVMVTGEHWVSEVLRVDRPFLFLIRDAEKGTILFLGHVVNPATS